MEKEVPENYGGDGSHGLPSAHCPSDHLALTAVLRVPRLKTLTFMVKNKEEVPTGQQQQQHQHPLLNFSDKAEALDHGVSV